MQPRMERYLTVLSMLVLAALAVSLTGLQQEATVTGRAASDASSVAESVFGEMDKKLRDAETFRQDYEKHQELISSMVDEAKKSGSQHPFISVAQMYYESGYFEESAIRCEKHYEKRWLQARDACEDGQCGSHPWSATYSLCEQVDGTCDKEIHCNNCGEYGCDTCHFSGGGRTFHRISCSYGLGQITYRTALDLGYEGTARDLARRDELNMKYSMRLLNEHYEEFAQEGSSQPLVDAIMAYNTGKDEVRRAKQAHGESFSDYVKGLQRPSHRVRYVASIFIYAQAFEAVYKDKEMQDWPEYIERAKEDFQGNLPPSTSLPQYTASASPQMSVTLPYSFQDFERLKEGAEKLTSTCSGNNLRTCIETTLKTLDTDNLTWQYGEDCSSEDGPGAARPISSILRRCAHARSPTDGPCECVLPSVLSGEYHAVEAQDGLVVHGGGDSVYVAGANLSGTLTFQDGQLADGAVLLNDNGTLRSAQSASSSCFLPPNTYYRFCVNRTPGLKTGQAGSGDRNSVLYRFALAFDPGMDTPPASGVIHSTQGGERVITFETQSEWSDSSETLVTTMAGVES